MARVYRKSGLSEWFRMTLRSLDFMFLMLFLSRSHPVFNRNHTRQCRLLELGPGPLKLRAAKQRFFASLNYVDHLAYPDAGEDVIIFDLEDLPQLSNLTELCVDKSNRPLFIFADHCLEHLKQPTVLGLIGAVKRSNSQLFFRVPNVLSLAGKANYLSDETHQTDFGVDFRARLAAEGVAAHYWIRFYRLRMWVAVTILRRPIEEVAEEILFVQADAANHR